MVICVGRNGLYWFYAATVIHVELDIFLRNYQGQSSGYENTFAMLPNWTSPFSVVRSEAAARLLPPDRRLLRRNKFKVTLVGIEPRYSSATPHKIRENLDYQKSSFISCFPVIQGEVHSSCCNIYSSDFVRIALTFVPTHVARTHRSLLLLQALQACTLWQGRAWHAHGPPLDISGPAALILSSSSFH